MHDGKTLPGDRGFLPLARSYLLREPASEEGVKVLSIKPHEALQILPLVYMSLVFLLRQF